MKIRREILGNKKIEVTGFEPATSASRTQRSTKLSHTSMIGVMKLKIFLQ